MSLSFQVLHLALALGKVHQSSSRKEVSLLQPLLVNAGESSVDGTVHQELDPFLEDQSLAIGLGAPSGSSWSHSLTPGCLGAYPTDSGEEDV